MQSAQLSRLELQFSKFSPTFATISSGGKTLERISWAYDSKLRRNMLEHEHTASGGLSLRGYEWAGLKRQFPAEKSVELLRGRWFHP